MKALIIFIIVVTIYDIWAAITSDVLTVEWESFKTSYDRNYSNSEEESSRKEIFEKKLQFVEDHNTRYEKEGETFQVKINHFADFSEKELHDVFNCFKRTDVPRSPSNTSKVVVDWSEGAIPESMDWRERGFMTPAKDQGKCNACWAFAAVGAIEARFKIKYESPDYKLNLSEQQLIDCAGKGKCNAGDPFEAYKYLATKGIESGDSYTYMNNKDKQECQFDKYTPIVTLDDFGTVASDDDVIVPNGEYVLSYLVATYGPVSVGIYISDADMVAFSSFTGDGIFTTKDCDNGGKTNFAVVVAGYGTQDGLDYWLLKSSFGTDWGDDGYVKIKRNTNNNCGIAYLDEDVTYPVFCKFL